jgi:transcriptional regulator with XRE-family HTH domain
MKNPDERILRLIDLLKYEKKITTQQEFCEAIGMVRQTITKIRNQTSYFTVKQIDIICKKYNVNANWIFGIQTNVFLTENSIEIKH